MMGNFLGSDEVKKQKVTFRPLRPKTDYALDLYKICDE